ncbi:pyrroline-5-carboxylate reductase [Terrihabitans soli]|uniref:Pyrroline-5-carboxylate reductase n=1 Tax=Terrihabitans soli TaxID=708113 RepID=A0A6S6QLD1_9HYPH|nr:pyrroline-5-carboxylate reductase [Terrihabitans soli]BCJ90116.1 pyrroline-5-carboxylate reductase [Terrihabitans soli]
MNPGKKAQLALPGPLLLVGAGKMGGALLNGWLRLGLDPSLIYVVDPQPSFELKTDLRDRGIALNPASMVQPKVVLLAVKPQILSGALKAVALHVDKDTLVISILAGATLGALDAGLPSRTAIIRTMPNTPAAIGRGVTVMIANAEVSPEQRALASQLMEAVGDVAWIGDEALMDAVTAVSGSGPAYVFFLAEALARAGVKAGLPPELAAQLASATVAGAGELMHRTGTVPETLRKNVTSPGGTTAAALEILMAPDGLEWLLTAAVKAATERSRELGKG